MGCTNRDNRIEFLFGAKKEIHLGAALGKLGGP